MLLIILFGLKVVLDPYETIPTNDNECCYFIFVSSHEMLYYFNKDNKFHYATQLEYRSNNREFTLLK